MLHGSQIKPRKLQNLWYSSVLFQALAVIIVYLTFQYCPLACENSCLSLLITADDILRRGTSAPQRQKFHIDDINQCLCNKCSSQGVPNVDLFDFMSLLVDYGKVLCSSRNKLQHNSNASSSIERKIFHKYWLVCGRFIAFTFDLCDRLSFVCRM